MRPDLILESFADLYPEKSFPFQPILKYSAKFKGFNANIKLRRDVLTVSMSKQWRQVSKDIQMGLIQDLMVRLLKDKRSTTNMQLYLSFMKNVHLAVPKTKTDPLLADAFHQINQKFFDGLMEMPNFEWMGGRRTVGLYEYGTDTILISRHLKDSPQLLGYVMYHEMLHKKHKFASKPGRQCHHSKAFREEEAKFPNAQQLERELMYVGRRSRPSMLSWLGF